MPEIQEPPEPEPGTSEWEYVEEPIDEVKNYLFCCSFFLHDRQMAETQFHGKN